MILYVPPLRQDYAPPYDREDYAHFKGEVRAMAARHGARWINLEKIVPGPLWGTKAATGMGGKAELDFMHYQAQGHRLLAEALMPVVEEELK